MLSEPDAVSGRIERRSDSAVPGMLVFFVLTFLLRFATVRFPNDHFTHLSRARQILLGEWPIRDFFDPGQFLHYYLSAAAQVVFGPTLFGEALLTSALVALGTALTYGVSSRLAGSRTIGALAALLLVVSFPRLYNYPKIVLYPAALWLAWWYAHEPGRRRVAALAGFSALAFLMRYDHGAYLGLFMTLLIVLSEAAPARRRLRMAGRYLGIYALLLVPFAVYVQWAQGVPQYAIASLQPARTIANASGRVPTLRVNFSAEVEAGSEPPATDAARLPGAGTIFTLDHALTWGVSAVSAIPWLTLGLAGLAWRRGRLARAEGAVVVASAGLCIVITRTLVSNDVAARLADVTGPVAALGAWSTAHLLASIDQRMPWRRVAAIGLLAVFAVTAWSLMTPPRFLNRLRDAELHEGLEGARVRFVQTWNRLRLRPIDYWAPPREVEGLPVLGRYVMRCTLPSDRLLVAGAFAPEVYYYTERAFAGGQVHFLPRWHDSPADQQLTIERILAHDVPVALIGDDASRFERRFVDVARFIQERYVEVPFTMNSERQPWRVFVERGRIPSRVDLETGLPCYDTADVDE